MPSPGPQWTALPNPQSSDDGQEQSKEQSSPIALAKKRKHKEPYADRPSKRVASRRNSDINASGSDEHHQSRNIAAKAPSGSVPRLQGEQTSLTSPSQHVTTSSQRGSAKTRIAHKSAEAKAREQYTPESSEEPVTSRPTRPQPRTTSSKSSKSSLKKSEKPIRPQRPDKNKKSQKSRLAGGSSSGDNHRLGKTKAKSRPYVNEASGSQSRPVARAEECIIISDSDSEMISAKFSKLGANEVIVIDSDEEPSSNKKPLGRSFSNESSSRFKAVVGDSKATTRQSQNTPVKLTTAIEVAARTVQDEIIDLTISDNEQNLTISTKQLPRSTVLHVDFRLAKKESPADDSPTNSSTTRPAGTARETTREKSVMSPDPLLLVDDSSHICWNEPPKTLADPTTGDLSPSHSAAASPVRTPFTSLAPVSPQKNPAVPSNGSQSPVSIERAHTDSSPGPLGQPLQSQPTVDPGTRMQYSPHMATPAKHAAISSPPSPTMLSSTVTKMFHLDSGGIEGSSDFSSPSTPAVSPILRSTHSINQLADKSLNPPLSSAGISAKPMANAHAPLPMWNADASSSQSTPNVEKSIDAMSQQLDQTLLLKDGTTPESDAMDVDDHWSPDVSVTPLDDFQPLNIQPVDYSDEESVLEYVDDPNPPTYSADEDDSEQEAALALQDQSIINTPIIQASSVTNLNLTGRDSTSEDQDPFDIRQDTLQEVHSASPFPSRSETGMPESPPSPTPSNGSALSSVEMRSLQTDEQEPRRSPSIQPSLTPVTKALSASEPNVSSRSVQQDEMISQQADEHESDPLRRSLSIQPSPTASEPNVSSRTVQQDEMISQRADEHKGELLRRSPSIQPSQKSVTAVAPASELNVSSRPVQQVKKRHVSPPRPAGVMMSWSDYRKDLSNFERPVYFNKDLPRGMLDHVNSMSNEFKSLAGLRLVYEQMILENTVADEPNAPRIHISNEVDLSPTPPWEFHYTNHMWLGEGVPVPDLTKLVSCDCIGPCDPTSPTCACAVRHIEVHRQIDEDGDQNDGFVYDKNGRIVIDDESFPIFECNDLCRCDEECRNRVVQHGRKCEVKIVKTLKKGWGVFAGKHKIPKGTFVGIYAGELVTYEESEPRAQFYNGFGRTYLFDLDFYFIKLPFLKAGNKEDDWQAKYVVDAFHAGNFTRFLNHSCDPNCVIRAVYINNSNEEMPLLTIFTNRDIDPDEELCFSYSGGPDSDTMDKKQVKNDPIYARCHCGAPNCSGAMF